MKSVVFARNSLVALLLLLLVGCAGGLRLEELPEQPIAFLYHTEAEARRNDEIRDAREGVPTRALAGTAQERWVVATPKGLGRLLGVEKDKEVAPGRLVFLNPRTGELERAEFASLGSWPQAWSKNHERLLVTRPSSTGAAYQLYEIRLDTLEVRQLTYGKRQHPFGSFGPQGRYLVVGEIPNATRDRALWLYLLESDGRQVKILEDLESWKEGSQFMALIEPIWSPDGSLAVFQAIDKRERSTLFGLDMSNRDSKPRFLARGMTPTFTPDGEWIVYAAPGPKDPVVGSKLWRIRPNGSGRTQVGQGRGSEREPAVSPDGKFIVYTVEEYGRTRLYIKRFDGSGERVLLTDGDGSFPVW